MAMRKEIAFYAFIAFLLLGMVYVSATWFRGSGKSVVGVATSDSHRVVSEEGGVVVHVYAVPGQQVRAGDTLIRLTSNDLQIDLEKTLQRLELLNRERAEKEKLLASRIEYVKAQTEIRTEEIRSDIDRLKKEAEFNRSLASALHSDEADGLPESPLETQVQSMEKEIVRHQDAMKIRIADLRQENRSDMETVQGQIHLYEKELALLRQREGRLVIRASSGGVVESAHIRDGESAESFAPLLSIRPDSPTSVVGYASLPVRVAWKIGDGVQVRSSASNSVPGRVIGFGEVVPLPDVLQQSTAAKAFGREIFIEIAPGGPFASGEKVLIR
jgi:HlyD family secretion protein